MGCREGEQEIDTDVKLFQALDKDGNGAVDLEELELGFQGIASRERIERVLAKNDFRRTRVIRLEKNDFINFMQKMREDLALDIIHFLGLGGASLSRNFLLVSVVFTIGLCLLSVCLHAFGPSAGGLGTVRMLHSSNVTLQRFSVDVPYCEVFPFFNQMVSNRT